MKHSNLFDDTKENESILQENNEHELEEAVRKLKQKGFKNSYVMAIVVEAMQKY